MVNNYAFSCFLLVPTVLCSGRHNSVIIYPIITCFESKFSAVQESSPANPVRSILFPHQDIVVQRYKQRNDLDILVKNLRAQDLVKLVLANNFFVDSHFIIIIIYLIYIYIYVYIYIYLYIYIYIYITTATYIHKYVSSNLLSASTESRGM